MSPGRISLYETPLRGLTEAQIVQACEGAAHGYKPYGGSFPSPADLLAFVSEPVIDDAPYVLSRPHEPEQDSGSLKCPLCDGVGFQYVKRPTGPTKVITEGVIRCPNYKGRSLQCVTPS